MSCPVRVTWANQLVDASGNFRPPLVTVDQTVHWANPPGGLSGRDTRSEFTRTHCQMIDHEDNEMMRPYQVG